MTRVVGVDGAKGGWFYVALVGSDIEYAVVPTIREVVDRNRDADLVLVDIPIGLRDEGVERQCDREARSVLKQRRSSVYPAPCREALLAEDYAEASATNKSRTTKKLSKQSWAIVPRIREVDELLTVRPELRRVVREIHPEVCFWGLNNKSPMRHNKKTRDGFAERLSVLRRLLPDAEGVMGRALLWWSHAAARDDVADALVGAVTAAMGPEGLRTLPERPERDCTGLPMEMVYAVT